MKFIIYAHSFNENIGGIIVLHQLCDLINKTEHKALLWKHKKPIFSLENPYKTINNYLKYYEKYLKKPYKTYKYFDTPIATEKDLKDAIVVYPEIIDGNPLKSDKVVRWLLHKPGYHSGRVNFGEKELIVGYGKEYSTDKYILKDENILYLRYFMDDIYKQNNYGVRKGFCYSVRKGKNKKFIHPKDAVCIDGLSHESINEIFNSCEYFISYDTYSQYSYYASLCGCKSVVVPDDNVSKEEWYPEEEKRYGLAYGMDDIDYALETRYKLINFIKKLNNNNFNMVENFIKLVMRQYA